eukprot:PhM_4_TR15832/c0_g1_i1/m.34363
MPFRVRVSALVCVLYFVLFTSYSATAASWTSKGTNLARGGKLYPGEAINSSETYLVLETTGNLVLYTYEAEPQMLWATNTSGTCQQYFELSPIGFMRLMGCDNKTTAVGPTILLHDVQKLEIVACRVVLQTDISPTFVQGTSSPCHRTPAPTSACSVMSTCNLGLTDCTNASGTCSSACGYSTSALCGTRPDCEWDTARSACKRSGARACGWGTSTMCASRTGCTYSATVYACGINKDNIATCNFADQDACNVYSTCVWSSNACKLRPSPVCTNTTKEACVADKSCEWTTKCRLKTVVSEPCGYPDFNRCLGADGCEWNGVSCSPKEYSGTCNYYEQKACNVSYPCYYNTIASTCTGYPTSQCAYDQTLCARFGGCKWSSSCVVNSEYSVPCGFRDPLACKSFHGCEWNIGLQSCYVMETSTACAYGHQSACNSVLGCGYINGQCVVKASATQACAYATSTACGTVKGCKWESDSRTCELQTNLATCGYGEELACVITRGCEWTSSCVVSSIKKACGYTTSSECKRVVGCSWIDGQCFAVGSATIPCNYGNSVTCSYFAGCQWSIVHNKCEVTLTNSDPCAFEDKTACQSITGCQWSLRRSACIPSATVAECAYGEKGICVEGGCRWDSVGLRCITKPSMDVCLNSGQSTCTSAGCAWTGTACTVTNPPSPCGYGDYGACTSVKGCYWDAPNVRCLVRSYLDTIEPCGMGDSLTCGARRGCAWANGQCIASASFVCGFSEKAACISQHGCAWSGVNCSMGTSDYPCGFSEKYACASTAGCAWDGSRCRVLRSTPRGECSYNQQSACNSIPGCQWASNVCGKAVQPPSPCAYGNQQACASSAGCTWTGGVCQPLPPSTPCGYADERLCRISVGCKWENHGCILTGASAPCDFSDEFACNALRGCSWTTAIRQCEKVTPTKPCAYDDYAACTDTAGCSWTSKCTVTGSSYPCGYGDSVTCNSVRNCHWSDNRCVVARGVVGCDFGDAAACRMSVGCGWSGNNCTTVSTQYPCYHGDQATCVSSGCVWSYASGSCSPPASGADDCKYADAAQCVTSLGCGWNAGKCVARGTASPCTYLRTPCTNILGCTWSSTAGCIMQSSYIADCQTTDPAACKTNPRCFWSSSNKCVLQSWERCRRLISMKCSSTSCYHDLWTCDAANTRCFDFDRESVCSALPMCVYSNGVCSRPKKECYRWTSERICVREMCEWNTNTSTCGYSAAAGHDYTSTMVRACSTFATEASCHHALCTWNALQKSCVMHTGVFTKQAQGAVSCSNLYSKLECELSECTWTNDANIPCYDRVVREYPMPVDYANVKCGDVATAVECLIKGCQWDSDTRVCVESTAVAAATVFQDQLMEQEWIRVPTTHKSLSSFNMGNFQTQLVRVLNERYRYMDPTHASDIIRVSACLMTSSAKDVAGNVCGTKSKCTSTSSSASSDARTCPTGVQVCKCSSSALRAVVLKSTTNRRLLADDYSVELVIGFDLERAPTFMPNVPSEVVSAYSAVRADALAILKTTNPLLSDFKIVSDGVRLDGKAVPATPSPGSSPAPGGSPNGGPASTPSPGDRSTPSPPNSSPKKSAAARLRRWAFVPFIALFVVICCLF